MQKVKIKGHSAKKLVETDTQTRQRWLHYLPC